MLTFRSMAEIQKARLPPRVTEVLTLVMRGLLQAYGADYSPDDDGYIVLVTPQTSDDDAIELMGRPWAEARLEGVSYDQKNRCFLSCVLFNNQFGLSIIVPDEKWLSPEFRVTLLEELGDKGGLRAR